MQLSIELLQLYEIIDFVIQIDRLYNYMDLDIMKFLKYPIFKFVKSFVFYSYLFHCKGFINLYYRFLKL